MSADKDVSLVLSEDVVRPIIEAKVHAAVLAAMGEATAKDAMDRIVSRALMEKVSESGKKSSYSSENKYTYLEIVCRNAIQEAARDAIVDWVAKDKDRIHEAVRKELARSPRKVAVAMIDAIINASKHQWRTKIQFGITE